MTTLHTAAGDGILSASARPLTVAVERSSGRGRMRRFGKEIVKFGIVGGSGVGVNFVVFNLLLHGLTVGAMTSTVFASTVAICTNYLGFRFFAYRDRSSRSTRQIVLFFVFSGVGVAAESALFSPAYHGLALDGPLGSNLAKALSIVLASAFRFFVYRTWVFQRDARPHLARAAPPSHPRSLVPPHPPPHPFRATRTPLPPCPPPSRGAHACPDGDIRQDPIDRKNSPVWHIWL